MCQLPHQRRQRVRGHPGRGLDNLTAPLSGNNDGFDVVDEPLVDSAEMLFESAPKRVSVTEQ
ncbi:Uncharacterised protein [Mycobacterium tuberculosis]|uniref:Uncharacterized protein n=1 Tax=Mycobacterium tuberculosis TaxID=1773 RepID=A0A916LAG4_MYCTX|nr:Uncharacterised protein [Mycobacterium tuberculosis]CKS44948.1 Uncharacterised protein [Mycobacterium tuberculosis]COW25982.1 Uncharacterised protein [Mycobacterium tuberculosis]COX89889.1 Uncharacterised protein [Mycobacterium tuberculosis]